MRRGARPGLVGIPRAKGCHLSSIVHALTMRITNRDGSQKATTSKGTEGREGRGNEGEEVVEGEEGTISKEILV